ncbi:MAG TPA: hypothetical protein VKZ98_12155, partial [Aquaticitalea sp.]|nr:hypothetical protein [Aquaticitalea sp.]
HVGFSLLFIVIMVGFKYLVDDASVIERLFVFAGYTYGPLLGLYAFGLFTKLRVKDVWVPIIAILSPILSYIISVNSLKWFGFEFGFFILILNGFLTFIGLLIISRSPSNEKSVLIDA